MKPPPMAADQNVVTWVRSGEKLKRWSLPPAEATSKTVCTPPGICLTDSQQTATNPVIRMENCSTSVQITAFMPPSAVYTVVHTPMTRTQVERGSPAISDRIKEGA